MRVLLIANDSKNAWQGGLCSDKKVILFDSLIGNRASTYTENCGRSFTSTSNLDSIQRDTFHEMEIVAI